MSHFGSKNIRENILIPDDINYECKFDTKKGISLEIHNNAEYRFGYLINEQYAILKYRNEPFWKKKIFVKIY